MRAVHDRLGGSASHVAGAAARILLWRWPAAGACTRARPKPSHCHCCRQVDDVVIAQLNCVAKPLPGKAQRAGELRYPTLEGIPLKARRGGWRAAGHPAA